MSGLGSEWIKKRRRKYMYAKYLYVRIMYIVNDTNQKIRRDKVLFTAVVMMGSC